MAEESKLGEKKLSVDPHLITEMMDYYGWFCEDDAIATIVILVSFASATQTRRAVNHTEWE